MGLVDIFIALIAVMIFLWVHMNIIKEIHIVSRKTQTNMSMRTIHAHLCDEVEKLIISVADENVKRCSPFHKRTVTGDVLKQVSDGD